MQTPAPLRLADVVLDVRTAGADAVYSYLASPWATPGVAVVVPLGPRKALGYVLRVYELDPDQLGYDPGKLKPLGPAIDGLSLPEPLLDLVKATSEEYLCSLSVALSAASPPGALDRLESVWVLNEEPEGALPPLQAEVVSTLKSLGGKLEVGPKKKLEEPMAKALRALQKVGIVREELSLAEPAEKKTAALYRLTPDDEAVSKFLKEHAKKRPAQALTLLRLKEVEESALAIGDIKGLCGVTESTVKQLIDAKLLQAVDPMAAPPHQPPTLNKHQAIAVDAIVAAVQSHEAQRFLLYGVTGSGKTEVYLRAAAEALKQGRQVLYLVPEIALATQSVRLLRERFGRAVAILHSELPPAERLSNWRAIRRGEAAIVLGARSALFAPLKDVGLIVMDEEHEGSYKQESAPRYHTKRLAEFLANRHGCPLVLGSATPSLESFTEAEADALTLLSLPTRAAEAKLPEVHIVDLAEGFRSGKPALFSDLLVEKMQSTLARGEQTILFLNRRSYAPIVMCRDCGHTFSCPNCAVSLTFSRKLQRLRCHHCGYSQAPPDLCPECAGNRLKPFGVGTEKVEEAVAETLPGARVARLDRDITQKRGALEEVLAAFGSGAIDVLVGTQMVAKGLNFPGVTLVGVIAADLSLNIPDFRASERTFQLLSQVAGRAGRGSRPGEVVVQTFHPSHIAVQAAQSHDFLQFYEAVVEERKEARYPPFRRLVNVVVSGEDRKAVGKHADTVKAALAQVRGVQVLGPTDCAIERLNNQWRMHVLAKLEPNTDVRAIPLTVLEEGPKGVQTVVDVDPYSMI